MSNLALNFDFDLSLISSINMHEKVLGLAHPTSLTIELFVVVALGLYKTTNNFYSVCKKNVINGNIWIKVLKWAKTI